MSFLDPLDRCLSLTCLRVDQLAFMPSPQALLCRFESIDQPLRRLFREWRWGQIFLVESWLLHDTFNKMVLCHTLAWGLNSGTFLRIRHSFMRGLILCVWIRFWRRVFKMGLFVCADLLSLFIYIYVKWVALFFFRSMHMLC